ncbi:MAG: MFS transporter [Pirellulaceae bacterium]|nr:MFS transporter [Pirellulaceae bacterium]
MSVLTDPAGKLAPPGNSPTRIRWIVFLLACGTSFLTYIHRYSWGVARPYLKEESGLSDTDLGWLDAAFSLTYALGQFPGGWLGDRYGPRLVITFAVVAWSLAAASPAFFGGVKNLLAGRLIFGLVQAPSYPNLGKVTRSWFPLSIRTSVQGMVAGFAGRAGAGLAPILMATVLIGVCGVSWQTAICILASAGLLFAVVFWFGFRNRPAEHPLANEAEQRLVQGSEINEATSKTRFHWSRANVVNFAIFMVTSFCATFADNLFVFWMPQYLVEEKGLGPYEMGLFASLPLWGGALGGMCGGVLNDLMIRLLGNRRWARSLVASTGMGLAAVFMLASLYFENGRYVMLVLFFCKFFFDWGQPTWWGTVTDIGGPASGRVFGVLNMCGALGATVAGPAMGLVKMTYGFPTLFGFVAVVYVVAAFLWLCLNCTRTLVVAADDQE